MKIDTQHLRRCIATLEKANEMVQKADPETIDYDIYRAACVKEFEISLELSGKLLKKVLKRYFHSSKAVDELSFKDIFRHAVLHNIIIADAGERWLKYRDNRNTTAHDYGPNFAQETLSLLPSFIGDAADLAKAIDDTNNDV
jgi:nucleotidyltransferase substrate binding protein (TIGR01987 family)